MSNENFKKRMTFQGLFDAQKQKVPERTSRSRSKSRSKASSITKSVGGGMKTNRSWRKTEAKNSFYTQQSQTRNEASSTSENIFRQKQKRAQQDLMKKIIKLKNTATKVETRFKQQIRAHKEPSQSGQNPSQQFSKFTQIQDYLQEFDVEVRRQTKEITETYLKKLDEEATKLETQEHNIPSYSFIKLQPSFQMASLESRLTELESKWN